MSGMKAGKIVNTGADALYGDRYVADDVAAYVALVEDTDRALVHAGGELSPELERRLAALAAAWARLSPEQQWAATVRIRIWSRP